MAGRDLEQAKRDKVDEFYTQMYDIEIELRHYREYFKHKVVLCNCDDPYESNFFKYLLFVSFFPQILQGPIPRYNQLKEQLFEGHTFDYKTVKFGFQLILWGMFLKMVIADRAAIFVNAVFPEYHLYEGTVLLLQSAAVKV